MDTKIKSYYQTIAEGLPKRHREILDCLSMVMEPRSRAVISASTGLSLQCVCGRVNELLKMGMVIVSGEVYDLSTQRLVEAVTINKSGEGIKPMAKKITPTKMKEYIDYLWNFRRTDVDVCSLEQWANG